MGIPVRLSGFIYAFAAAGLLLSATSSVFAADATPIVSEDDILTRARNLSSAKKRPEALALLQKHLEESPTDVDARLLYGEMLSWEGRWDEAREALEGVLNQTPTYTDAALALINVELWSDHPEQADKIANRFLERTPNHIDLLLARARVMRALKRPKEEMQVLDTVLRLAPSNDEARDMRRSREEQSRAWKAAVNVNTILFSDHRSPWEEQYLSVSRGLNAGSLILRVSRAYQYGYKSTLGEVDWYPSLRPGTYMYLNAGYSPEGILYPTFRAGAELFQSLGHGYEASAGLRRLQFTSTRINVYTASAGRYHKDWYGSIRTFVTPGDPKPSVSFQVQLRRYFGDGERYLSFRYGRGAAPFEIRNLNQVGVLDSTSYTGEVYWRLRGRLLLNVIGGLSGDDRISNDRLTQYYLSSSFYYRF
jgi:YaiO family outer membrane protein